MSDSTSLKSCPFCGNMPLPYKLPYTGMFGIKCIPCGLSILDDREDKLVATWNNRFPPVQEVIDAYQEYINLLAAEINDLSSIAIFHGWKSTRHTAGEEARAKIATILAKHLEE